MSEKNVCWLESNREREQGGITWLRETRGNHLVRDETPDRDKEEAQGKVGATEVKVVTVSAQDVERKLLTRKRILVISRNARSVGLQ